MSGAGKRVKRARNSRRDSQSSPSRVLPAAEHYSLADLDAIYRDTTQDLLFNIETPNLLEQAMLETHNEMDRSIFSHGVARNNLLDSDDSKDFLGEAPPPPGLISDSIDMGEMDLDVDLMRHMDPLLNVKPPEPDFEMD